MEASGVRVRFAPSPTGYLHVGGARTALFNWLFARHENGNFILRIEDTDLERSSVELENQMLEDLEWLGLNWDEGPRVGGGYGPYRQSERVDIYRDLAGRLQDEGKAYPCFCTDGELEIRKTERMKGGLSPHYDGTCRRLGEGEREKLRKEGRPESIRFLFPGEEAVQLTDIIRGDVTFPPGMVGDFVIIRSNGFPTYNFAAVVDDALMKITHVIRGEEHLSNTLRQVVVYEALGFGLPSFAHIPLILGPDRSKLSKRHGAPNIVEFHRRGYPPEAVINYIALLGWSAAGDREILSAEEMIHEFQMERVSNTASIFDEVKMNWVSSQHIRAGGAGRYFEEALPYFPEDLRVHYTQDKLRGIFEIVSDNLTCFSKIEEETACFRPGVPALGEEVRETLSGTGVLLATISKELRNCREWERSEIAGAIKNVGKKLAIKGKDLYMPLRAALTGVLHGTDLSSIMEIRGREDVLSTLESASRKTDL